MADQTPPQSMRQMSLIPYATDSREVVLRRGNAVVVFDPNSQQLSVRSTADQPVGIELTDCPYCHQPLRKRDGTPDDGDHGRSFGHEAEYVDQDYFAMLAASQRPSPTVSGSVTPNRRVPIAIRSGRSREVSASAGPPAGAELVGSDPLAPSDQGISSSAFSPGYFQQFFREDRELGRGGNGVVLLVEHVIDGVSLGHFACKRIPVGDSRNYFEKVIVEVRLLQKIPHKNLVAYHWTWLEDYQPSKFGPSIPCLWILQDYCDGGDLHSYVLGPQTGPPTTERLKNRLRRKSKGNTSPHQDLRGPSKLSFDEIFSFFRDITSGLHHLHTKGYIHRDLKPSNCLLQRDGGRTRVLISDLGEVQAAGVARMSSGATGTISYCAPEVLQRIPDGSFGNFTTKSDIFSLGMIVYFMCFGRLPYASSDGINEENEDLDELRAEICKWTGFNDETRARSDLPEKLYAYLKRLLSVDPNARPGTDEILASIKGGVALEDGDWTADDYSPRVSSVDSPAPKASSRTRKAPYMSSPKPGLCSPARHYSNEKVRARSPIKREGTHSRPTSPQSSSLAISPRKLDLSPPPATSDATGLQQNLRLMLPPPPPPPQRSTIEGMLHVTHRPWMAATLRAIFFLGKVLATSVPCAPYAPNPWLMYPLLAMAAMDLGLVQFSMRQSLLLLSIHLAAVFSASQQSRLCEAGNLVAWEHF